MNPSSPFDLLCPKTMEDPYPFYAWLREHAPVYRVPGTDVHLVSKRELILDVLDRQADFSANLTGTLMTGASGAPVVFDLSRFGTVVDALATADEPAHTLHRKLVLSHVSPKRIACMESPVRSWAVDALEAWLAQGGGDFMAAVANPIPTRATALLVGVPVEDADRLLAWSMAGGEIMAGTTTLERIEWAGEQTAELGLYLTNHLKYEMELQDQALEACTNQGAANGRPPHSPPGREIPSGRRSGVISEVASSVREGRLSQADGVANLIVLTSAGGESTAALTGNAVRILAQQPELQNELRAKPERIASFVEEAVRLESSFRGHYRLVPRRTRLADVELEAGARVVLLWGAANRDPEVFENPDAVDLDRKNLHEHIAFGHGIHFCVGARLARLQVRVILEELLARTAGFSIEPDNPPSYVRSLQVRRLADLVLRVHAAV